MGVVLEYLKNKSTNMKLIKLNLLHGVSSDKLNTKIVSV